MLVSHKFTILCLCYKLHAWNNRFNCKLTFPTNNIYGFFDYINLK